MVRKLSPEKREQFLRSALRLFVANDVQHTSTASIAREAGTATGTLFLYFPTKQELINELILKISRDQSDHIKTLLVPSLSARETFFRIWDGSVRWFLVNMDAYQYVRQVRDSGTIPEAVVFETAKSLEYYYDAIRKGLEEGAIKPYPAEVIGTILYQDIVAVMEHLRLQPDPGKQEEAIQQGFELFWDGISIRKDQ